MQVYEYIPTCLYMRGVPLLYSAPNHVGIWGCGDIPNLSTKSQALPYWFHVSVGSDINILIITLCGCQL